MNRLKYQRFFGLALLLVPACGDQGGVAKTEQAVNSGMNSGGAGNAPAVNNTGAGAGTTQAATGQQMTATGATGNQSSTTQNTQMMQTTGGATGQASGQQMTTGNAGAQQMMQMQGSTGGTMTTMETGTGGATGGTMEMPMASGGTDTGTGGTDTGAGGTDTGTAGTDTGAAGTPTMGPTDGIDPAVFAPEIDGFYWEGTCTGSGTDDRQCSLSADGNAGSGCTVSLDEMKTVNGEANKAYVMEIEVRGLLGSRCYAGGMRRAGDTPPDLTGPNDGLYTGGTVPGNWWNTYEIHVMNPPPGAESTFFLNAYSNETGSGAYEPDTCTMEAILEVKYTFEISVMGNSTLLFRIDDQNCQAQMNCGPYEDVKTCPTQRTVDLTGMNPPADFDQPPINAIGNALFYPQWAYFDVKSVTEVTQ